MWNLVRFEAMRFLRHPRAWLLMIILVGSNSIPIQMGDDLDLGFVWFAVFSCVLAGFVGPSTLQSARLPGEGTEPAYLLSRTGTRTRVLASRGILFVAMAAALILALAVVFTARGKISAHSRAEVHWDALAAIEAATGAPVETEPGDVSLHRYAQEKERSTRYLRAHVELPWAGATILVLMFLALLFGFSLHTAQGPGVPGRWEWKLLRRPTFHATWIPFAAVLLLLIALIAGDAAERLFIAVHFHLGAVVAAALALIMLYAWLSLQQWRTADL